MARLRKFLCSFFGYCQNGGYDSTDDELVGRWHLLEGKVATEARRGASWESLYRGGRG